MSSPVTSKSGSTDIRTWMFSSPLSFIHFAVPSTPAAAGGNSINRPSAGFRKIELDTSTRSGRMPSRFSFFSRSTAAQKPIGVLPSSSNKLVLNRTRCDASPACVRAISINRWWSRPLAKIANRKIPACSIIRLIRSTSNWSTSGMMISIWFSP